MGPRLAVLGASGRDGPHLAFLALRISLSLMTGTRLATHGVGPISSVTRSMMPSSICFLTSLLTASLSWKGTGLSFCLTGRTLLSNSRCILTPLTHPSLPLNVLGNSSFSCPFEYLPLLLGEGYSRGGLAGLLCAHAAGFLAGGGSLCSSCLGAAVGVLGGLSCCDGGSCFSLAA